jgi:hypothetical protein
MEDIQALTKPSNIPPVTLAELNDYSEGNKDQWINNHKYGAILKKASDFRPDRIYYLGAKLENPKRVEETIGYIDPYNRGGQVFLPFYKRINVIGEPTTQWEDYTTNFNVGGQIKYAFVFYLGTNEPAERERRRAREDEEREGRRAGEDDTRDSRRVQEEIERSNRMMEQMNAQNEGPVRLAEEKRKAQSKERESLNESVNKAPFDSIQDNELGGSRRRRRRSRKLKQSRRRTRKLKQSRNSRKLRKSRK